MGHFSCHRSGELERAVSFTLAGLSALLVYGSYQLQKLSIVVTALSCEACKADVSLS